MSEELEAALVKGLNSGTEIEMSTDEWKRLHDECEAESLSERQASIPNTLEELEEMLLEGLHSGPCIVMNDAEWSRLREEIEADAHADHRAS